MGLFSNIGNIVDGLKDSLDPAGIFGGSRSGTDIFSTFFDPGDITGTQSSKAKKAERKRLKAIEEKRERLKASKQVAEQIRKSIIARASIVADSEKQNVGGSSAALGGAGSVLSQAGGNIGFINQLQSLNQQTRNRLTAIEEIGFEEQQTKDKVAIATTFFGGF
jgi:hypothetical protein